MQSTVYFTALNDPIERQGPHGLVNANITLRPRRHWSIGVFARNLTDTDYLTGTSSVPPPRLLVDQASVAASTSVHLMN